MRALLAGLGVVAAVMMAVVGAFADDRSPLVLKSLAIAPAVISTSAGSAQVTLTFTANDAVSGITYFEAAFSDPTGSARQSASARFTPALSVTNSVRVTFPRFSNAGTWALAQVFLSDVAGNTLLLDAADLSSHGFPTRLEVTSAKDTVSPKLTALDFSPTHIDTSIGPAEVKVNYTVTDDLSGVSHLELYFVSPSGVGRQGRLIKLDATQSSSGSMIVSLPRLSEPGRWKLNTVFLSDAAGNTSILDADMLSGSGFRTDLDVKSAADTVPPKLTALRLTPDVIDTSHGPVTVEAGFTASDDLSGVQSLEVVLTSASGTSVQRGTAVFSPATEITNSVKLTFPRFSEPGRWRASAIHLADAAGNTLILDADGLAAAGFQRTVEVRSASDTVAPTLTAFSFEPGVVDTTRGPATVKVAFRAADNMSGVKSVEVVFVSPSGIGRHSGHATFPPASQVSGSLDVVFPQSSEAGAWMLSSVIVADEAGNTQLLDADDLASRGRRFLQVR